MKFKSSFYSLLVATSIAYSNASYAQVTTHFDYGVLVGTGPWSYMSVAPNNFVNTPFAHLQVDDFGASSEYTLSINNNLFSSFGSGAYLKFIMFDYVPNVGSGLTTSFLGSNVAGMTAQGVNGTFYGGVTFDFGTLFAANSPNQLGDNSFVKWGVGGVGSSGGFYLAHSTVSVGNITLPSGSGPYVAKYATIPEVPEPEAYAMLLAGLGLFGFTARRRSTNGA